jgi:MarR family transcriptional regulator, organic hydroperoxide resistance regulator
MTNKKTIQTNEELSMAVLKQFRSIYGAARKQFKDVEDKFGLTGTQAWLLQEIHKEPDIGVSDLALKLSIHQSTCSQHIEKLVKKEFVIKNRNESDQRSVGLNLSNKSKKLLLALSSPAEGILPKALSSMSKSELNHLKTSLDQVIELINVKTDEFASKHLSEI